MNTANKLLDKYRQVCLLKSDNAAAIALGIERATVSGWRHGKSKPEADTVAKMATAINEPVGPWLAQIESERARTPAAAKVWLRLAATLGTALAVAVIALPSHATTIARTAADDYLLCKITISVGSGSGTQLRSPCGLPAAFAFAILQTPSGYRFAIPE